MRGGERKRSGLGLVAGTARERSGSPEEDPVAGGAAAPARAAAAGSRREDLLMARNIAGVTSAFRRRVRLRRTAVASAEAVRRISAGTIAIVAVALLWTGLPSAQQDTPTMSAMRDELDRSMSLLRIKDQPAPYYIEYEVEDRAATRVTARLGAIAEDLTGKGRTLRVEVRVGDYNFDNSLFNAPNFGSGVVQLSADGSTSVALDDDYDSMRRQIWLATDSAYKRAVSVYARKRAAFQNRTGTEQLPDFSKEKPAETILPGLPLTFVNRDWPARAQQLSAVFLGPNYRNFDTSEVSVADTRGTRYYINTEGTKVVAPIQIASIRVTADARADDG